ncbi:MAG: LacI family transcriptional regulator [Propionibacteriaceae bacterium]|nr:LacI family transcriptional regulator [Propionibacteriaceae bacterium]
MVLTPGTAAKRTTMREVAALAGVSLKTVSRVINNESGVAQATSQRVTKAIDVLRYVPDTTAARLARGDHETQTIALLIASVDDPFSASLFRGVEEVAHTRQVAVFAASTGGDPEVETRLVHAFASRNVDGLIITPTAQDHRMLADFLAPHMPCVYIDRQPAGISGDLVTSDNRQAGRDATQHLIDYGHRRIGLITDLQSISTAVDRELGYRDALAGAGIEIDEQLITHGAETEALGEAAATFLMGLDDPPTALFAARNMASIGAIRVLRRLGKLTSVALVGMDRIELSDLIEPPLTVVTQDPVEMGRLATTHLFGRLDGDDSPPERVLVPTRLEARGSGEIRR